MLRDLLEDPNPLVRATGAEGVCRIGSVFWELIPAVGILLWSIFSENVNNML